MAYVRTLAVAVLSAALVIPASPVGAGVPARKAAPSSADLAWTLSGDGNGLHVLAATASTGYAWRTVATLSEPGFDTDQWIGNACLTASARRLVVVYGPRTFTNRADLFDRGGFTAVVDLPTGTVAKIAIQSSLAYFNPGCGAGEAVVLTQLGGQHREGPADGRSRSRLIELDAATARLSAPVTVDAELTSAVPVAGGFVAAGGSRLVRVGRDGTITGLTVANGSPFHVKADSAGGVVFLDRSGDRVRVRHQRPGRQVRTLAEGRLSEVSVAAGAGGRVFITGAADLLGALPAEVSKVDAPAGARLSSHGDLALSRVGWADTPDPRTPVADPAEPRAVRIEARETRTGQARSSRVVPSAVGSGRTPHPKLLAAGGDAGATVAGSPSEPVELERFCSVPRNDPKNQAMQPKPRQVEWAVDQAVTDSLYVQREANWKNLDMPAYRPQDLFPPIRLDGGGRVPAQVMLGILAQESNLWQASYHAMPGVTANPLIGNYYGRLISNPSPADDWDIHWDEADCGYGVAQVTDGMRLIGHAKPGEFLYPYQTQRAVALDFAVNVAAGLQILQDKWNQTRRAGLIINSGDPGGIEHWFFAVWAYNSGFYPNLGNGAPWGVGWANNPINPRYPADRTPFMELSYADAATPQFWPYPEKVMGFAGHPPELPEGPGVTVAGYRPAWWVSAADRASAKPPVDLFCDASNDCFPGQHNVPTDPEVIGEPAGPCAHRNGAGQFDLKCWYHQPAQWKDGSLAGHELLRFDPGYAYQADATSFPPKCDLTGLPGGSLIIDDLVDGIPSIRPGCGHPWTNAGKFGLQFSADGSGLYPSKIDFHQIGGGFGGHFWFAHTRKPADQGGKLKVTGTWSFTTARNDWARIFVHLPDHGAHTQQAKYEIDLGNGTFSRYRFVPQRTQEHRWVSLGVFKFAGKPRVRLSTETRDGFGEQDVAWDAVALQPLPGKPKNIVVALGDSYSSGEGAGNYYGESDNNYGNTHWDACRRSKDAWSRKVMLPGMFVTVGLLDDIASPSLDYSFVACSGAHIPNLTYNEPSSWTDPTQFWRSDGQFREVPQVDAGYLDVNTTLVTMSAGGNDAGFVSLLMECGGFSDCSNGNLEADYRVRIDSTQTAIDGLVRQVSAKATNALIVLMGYPQIFSDTVKCSGSWYFDGPEADMLNRLADYMAQRTTATVAALASTGIHVVFADPRAEFADHGACDAVEYVHKFVLGPEGGGDNPIVDDDNPNCMGMPGTAVLCISRASFHPNTNGTDAYARVLRTALINAGYSGV